MGKGLGRKLAMWKKYGNYQLTEQRFRERAEVLDCYPSHAFIDPSTICNLRCPFCAIGNDTTDQVKQLMPFDDFKRIIDMTGDYLLQVEIYQYGEPMLNPDIFRMIEYAKARYIYTRISTNLNFLNKEKAQRIVESGLDYLTLSIDGASQETYSKYRVGGNYDRVIQNLKLVVEAKRARKSKTPLLVWQFLLFRHNEHEVDKARAMAQEIGIDIFSLMRGYTPPEEKDWIPTDESLIRHGFMERPQPYGEPPVDNGPPAAAAPPNRKMPETCKWLWTHLIVSSNGIVSPCCRRSVSVPEFGNILDVKDFHELWNSDGFRSARRFFATGEPQTPQTLCENCPIVIRDIVPLAFDYAPTYAKRLAVKLYGKYKDAALGFRKVTGFNYISHRKG